jgi:hypothetical protein
MARFDITKVEAAIREQNYWQETIEWRLFTPTSFYIARVEQLDAKMQTKSVVYTVRVCCDYELRCECKTLERALHFCDVFQDWIEIGFKTEGWPGWTTATQP